MEEDVIKQRERLLCLARVRYYLDLYKLDGWRPGLLTAQMRSSSNTLGVCHYDQKLILIYDAFIDSPDREAVFGYSLDEIIKHEIAHALTPGAGHKKRWRKKAAEIGLKDAWIYGTSRSSGGGDNLLGITD